MANLDNSDVFITTFKANNIEETGALKLYDNGLGYEI